MGGNEIQHFCENLPNGSRLPPGPSASGPPVLGQAETATPHKHLTGSNSFGDLVHRGRHQFTLRAPKRMNTEIVDELEDLQMNSVGVHQIHGGPTGPCDALSPVAEGSDFTAAGASTEPKTPQSPAT